MKKSTFIYTFILIIFCFASCSPNAPKAKNNDPDADLSDIIETPPAKKINQSPEAETKPSTATSKEQTTTGTFLRIEQGDYFYLHLKDEKNKEMTFNLWQAYEGSSELNVDNWESVKGKKIKVNWEESEEFIPEANSKMMIKKVLTIDVLD